MPIQLKANQPVILTSSHSIAVSRKHFEWMQKKFKISGADYLKMKREEFPSEKLRRPVLEMARQIVSGRYDRSQVEEVETGFRLKGEKVCQVMQQEVFGLEDRRDEARLALITDLTRLGYRVGLLAADPAAFQPINPEFESKAQAAGVSGQDVLYLNWRSENNAESYLSFPRDLYTQLGDTVYISTNAGFDYDWGRFFKWAKGLEQKCSRIGIGGEVIIGRGEALLSELYQPALAGSPEKIKRFSDYINLTFDDGERLLQKKGYATFRLPTGWNEIFPPKVLEELGTTKRFFIPNDHVDMSAMLLPEERGLFFHAPYYQENREKLDPIVDQIKPDHFALFPDEEGHPVNSLPLPGGGVFMDMAARQSVALLRQMGIRVETTSQPFGNWAWGTWAGIHCSTNTVYLPGA